MSRRRPNSQRHKQPVDIQNILGNAIQQFQNGHPAKAKTLCRTALKSDPQNPTAYYLLGAIAHQSGYFSNAADLLVKSLQFDQQNPEVHNYLGITLIEAERLAEAEPCFQKALALAPNFPEAHNNLGNVLKDMGRAEEAIDSYRSALALRADYATAHNNLGCVLKGLEKYDQAIVSLKTAISIDPSYDEAYCNLGNAYFHLGLYDEATENFRAASDLNPSRAAHDGLGLALRQLGKLDDAYDCFSKAIAIEPNDADAYNGLGTVQHERGRFDDAVNAYQTALDINPKLAAAWSNFGSARKSQGRLEEAVSNYRKALEIDPNFSSPHSDLLFCLQYVPGITSAELKAEHENWYHMHGQVLQEMAISHNVDRSSKRPLRVGLISPDFRHHPVGFLAVKLVENIDNQDLQIFGYADQTKFDNYTKRFADAAHKWTKVYGLSDDQLIEQIQQDQIDILIDMTGHTAYNRLKLFCRKPAPVQITWCGYVCTTGIPTIDYIIADRFHIQPGEEKYYTETAMRLPGSSWCYDPPEGSPEVGPLPSSHNGFVTFGSFNNPSKINPEILETWSAILNRAPESKLLLKYNGMDSPYNIERISSAFHNNGIDRSRIMIEGGGDFAEMAARYNEIDIALDTLPYSGGVTTCEALWMGVPVVTCPGGIYPGRHSLSHLSNIGLTNCIAKNMDEYVNVAIDLASDLEVLSKMRAGLRNQISTSPLCDGPNFAKNFSHLIREIWSA
jgi:protein O-GlcNAc transferase